MEKTTELLDTIESNVLKLGSQHKSGQHTLVQDALNAIREVRQVTTDESNEERVCSCSAVKRIGVGKYCPDCGGRNSRR